MLIVFSVYFFLPFPIILLSLTLGLGSYRAYDIYHKYISRLQRFWSALMKRRLHSTCHS